MKNAKGLRFTAAGVALVCVIAACGSKDDSAGDSSSSSTADASAASSAPSSASSAPSSASSSGTSAAPAAASSDYTTLLIKPEDIESPEPFTDASPPELNPQGVPGAIGAFHTAGDTAVIVDQIALFDNADQATAAVTEFLRTANTLVKGSPRPVDVGSNGNIIEGTTPDGSAALTVVTFSEDNAWVQMHFASPPGDLNPAPTDFVTTVATQQADALQAGLPNAAPPPAKPAPTP
jgi:hypothetical protein